MGDAFGGVTQSQPWRQVGEVLSDFLVLRINWKGASGTRSPQKHPNMAQKMEKCRKRRKTLTEK